MQKNLELALQAVGERFPEFKALAADLEAQESAAGLPQEDQLQKQLSSYRSLVIELCARIAELTDQSVSLTQEQQDEFRASLQDSLSRYSTDELIRLYSRSYMLGLKMPMRQITAQLLVDLVSAKKFEAPAFWNSLATTGRL